jgi:hypothetical protein
MCTANVKAVVNAERQTYGMLVLPFATEDTMVTDRIIISHVKEIAVRM